MFLSDLRELGRRSSPGMQMVAQLMSHFNAQIVRSMAIANDPMFVGIALLEWMRNFAADLSPMGAFLKPNRQMANYVSRELAIGKRQAPSYAPYIFSDLSAAPWPVFSDGQTTALAKWKAN